MNLQFFVSLVKLISVFVRRKKGYFAGVMIWLSSFNHALAQPVMTKKLPNPKFCVIGIYESNFPVFEENYSDSANLINRGITIDKWIEMHDLEILKLRELKNDKNRNKFNNEFFISLNTEERLRFKEISVKLEYVIRGQKARMIKDFMAAGGQNMPDFYNNIEQIYFVDKALAEYILKFVRH